MRFYKVNCDVGLTSHSIIGQEFDKIIIPLDFNFFYTEQSITDSKTGEIKVFKLLERLIIFTHLKKCYIKTLLGQGEK